MNVSVRTAGIVAELCNCDLLSSKTNRFVLNRNVAQVTCQTQTSSKGHCTVACVCACARARFVYSRYQKLRLYSVGNIMEI